MLSTDGLMELLTVIGYPGIALIIFLESGVPFGFFLPGSSALFLAGFLSSTGVFDPTLLIIIVVIAAILGDTTGYIIGHYFGPALHRMKESRFYKREYLTKTHEFYDKHGGKAILLARFIPVVRTFAPIIAGIVGMRYRVFLLYNIIGGIGWAASVTFAGSYLGGRFPILREHIETVILVIIVVSLIPLGIEYLKKPKQPTVQ